MTAITFNAAPRMAMSESKLQSFFSKLAGALDAFAMYRMRRAVSESELLSAEREINRYRRLMRERAARQVAARPAALTTNMR
jgi:hypothetical protein